jgi:hypothetical protein
MTKSHKRGARVASRASKLLVSKSTLRNLSMADAKAPGPQGGRIPVTFITCVTKGCYTTKLG